MQDVTPGVGCLCDRLESGGFCLTLFVFPWLSTRLKEQRQKKTPVPTFGHGSVPSWPRGAQSLAVPPPGSCTSLRAQSCATPQPREGSLSQGVQLQGFGLEEPWHRAQPAQGITPGMGMLQTHLDASLPPQNRHWGLCSAPWGWGDLQCHGFKHPNPKEWDKVGMGSVTLEVSPSLDPSDCGGLWDIDCALAHGAALQG